jgi:hypothetical protein
MEVEFKGVFDFVDEWGRIVINHEDKRFNKYSWFKWKTKLIGKPSAYFMGWRHGQPAASVEFKQGDEVKVKLTFIPCYQSKGSTRRILFNEMVLIG